MYMPDDQLQWTDEYKLLTKKQLDIPSLHMIGHADFHTANIKLNTHYHCNMEFVVIINGKQQYIVNDKHYMLYGGDIFMTYPYENHGNGNTPQDICEFIWFQIDMSSSKNFLGLPPKYGEYLFRQCLNYQQRTKKSNPKDLPILRQAFQLLSSPNDQKRILGYSYFLQFIMSNIFTDDITLTKDIYSPAIQNAMSYISSHLTENLNIEAIAENCGLSPSHFKAKFKDELGITPYVYIMSLKIDTAKILLKNPKNTVTDVAFQLNFSSSNHFSSVFKKYTGYTPTDFRNQRFSNIY